MGADIGDRKYVMTISRMIIDKLGVKLYDKVSAAVAEIIANSYDADAEEVTVRLPLGTLLARKSEDGQVEDSDYVIEVEDGGHGMTPDEAIDCYLRVGRDRRRHPEQGPHSREKQRRVMGRKGIGKLAPFGICRRIEVFSSGGTKTESGYLVTHFYMDYEKILSDVDQPVELEAGPLDRTYREHTGTTVRLSAFLPKRVVDLETFHRQLASRFIFAEPDFSIFIEDARHPEENPRAKLEPFSVPTMEGTRIDLSQHPVTIEEGKELPVTGWLGLAKNAYKNEEMAGVRLYARRKIVATTRDFEQPAGFTGEFTVRSYLVGEVHAEWLDSDDGEDLIRSDRQGIIWESDYGRALRRWGAALIREIGAASRQPRRQRTSRLFMEACGFEEKAGARFADREVVDVAIGLAKQIGAFAAEDELEDAVYVDDLAEVILSVAPHKALVEAFQEFGRQVSGGEEVQLERLLDLFGKTRVAEMASYSQIAAERVKAIRELERIVLDECSEEDFQRLVSRAPWLVEPTWTVVTRNQALKTFKTLFEKFWHDRTDQEVILDIGFETKRPDFTLISVGDMLHIVEIKRLGHMFDDADFERLINYVYAFDEFFKTHEFLKTEFPRGWAIDLVADGERLKNLANRSSFELFREKGMVRRTKWNDFLVRAKQAHEQFLDISDRVREIQGA